MNNYIDFEIKDGILCRYLGTEKEVVIPETVNEIDVQAFLDCDTVESIVIPDGVECFVNCYAFELCTTVKKIYFGSAVTDIGSKLEALGGIQSVFRVCESLEYIEVSPENPNYSSKDGKLYNKDGSELLYDPKNPHWPEWDYEDDASVMTEMNKTYNSTYFALTIKKTGDPETDKKLNEFVKETLVVLKEIRRKHKDFLTVLSAGHVEMGGNSEDYRVTSELVDSGIKYDFQEKKNEILIKCFIDHLKISESFSVDNFALMSEFLNLVTITTDAGVAIDSETAELLEKGGKEFHDKMVSVVSRKIIFDYFKKIGIILSPNEILDSKVDFDDFLAVAAVGFAELNETDAIVSKMCKFFDGQILLTGKKDDNWNQESNVGKEYLLDDPERLWYMNMKEIIIKPYKYESDDGDVSIDMSLGEYAATCKMGMIHSKELIKVLDEIGKVYQANCEIAEKQNVNIDELGQEYVPHTIINGEIVPLDTVAVVSGDMELLEIPLTPLGSDVEMLLTEYPS